MFNITVRVDGKVLTRSFPTMEEATYCGERFVLDWYKERNFFSTFNNSWVKNGNRITKMFGGETSGRTYRGNIEITETT